MRIVEIEWLDACLEDSYLNNQGMNELRPMIRYEVGYLSRETDDFITISYGVINNQFKGENGNHMGFCIPRGCIKSIKKLEGGHISGDSE